MVLSSEGSSDASALLMLLISLLPLLQSTYRTSLSARSAPGFGRAAKTLAGTVNTPSNKRSERIVRQFPGGQYRLIVSGDEHFAFIVTSLSHVRFRILAHHQHDRPDGCAAFSTSGQGPKTQDAFHRHAAPAARLRVSMLSLDPRGA